MSMVMCKQVLCPLGAYINGLRERTLFVHLTEKLLKIDVSIVMIKGSVTSPLPTKQSNCVKLVILSLPIGGTN